MKKAAILLFGMYREFDTAIKQWSNIDSFYDCDYYMSTWNKSYQKYVNYNEYKKFAVTPEMITNYLPNCVYEILNQEEIFPIPVPTDSTSNYLFYHWKNVYKLMEKSNKTYDIVFLIRPDYILNIKNNFQWNGGDTSIQNWINNHPKDELYSSDFMLLYDINPFVFFTDDRFLIGSPLTIGKIIKTLPDMTDINLEFKSHIDLANHIISLGYRPRADHPFEILGCGPQYNTNNIKK